MRMITGAILILAATVLLAGLWVRPGGFGPDSKVFGGPGGPEFEYVAECAGILLFLTGVAILGYAIAKDWNKP